MFLNQFMVPTWFHLFKGYVKKYTWSSKDLIFQEKRREDEEAEALLDMQLAQEAAQAKMARDISNEVGCPPYSKDLAT